MTTPRVLPPLGAALLAFGIANGCSTPAVWPGAEQHAATAVGITDAIEVRSGGGPIDLYLTVEQPLTLAAAVRQAVLADPGLQAALADVRIALADANQARLLPNPLLTVALRIPEGGAQPIVEAGLAADLISILSMPGRVDVADARLRAASSEALTVALDTASAVQQTLIRVQKLEAQVPLAERRLALIERLLGLAQARLDAGEGSQLEVVALKAQRASIEADVDELLLARRERRLTLARELGRPGATADWPVAAWAAPAYRSVNERPWIEAALENRPEIERIRWELAALGAELNLAEWAAFEGSRAGIEAEHEDSSLSIGPAVAIPLPLFDWGQARQERAEAEAARQRHLLTLQQRRVVEEVRRTCAVFNESVHELRRAEEVLLPLSRQVRDLTEASYRAGQIAVMEVIRADQALAEAEERVIRVRAETALALIDLQRAVGGAVAEGSLIEKTPGAVSDQYQPIDHHEGADHSEEPSAEVQP